MVIKVQTVLLDLETAGIPANGAKAHICTLNWPHSTRKTVRAMLAMGMQKTTEGEGRGLLRRSTWESAWGVLEWEETGLLI